MGTGRRRTATDPRSSCTEKAQGIIVWRCDRGQSPSRSSRDLPDECRHSRHHQCLQAQRQPARKISIFESICSPSHAPSPVSAVLNASLQPGNNTLRHSETCRGSVREAGGMLYPMCVVINMV